MRTNEERLHGLEIVQNKIYFSVRNLQTRIASIEQTLDLVTDGLDIETIRVPLHHYEDYLNTIRSMAKERKEDV